ncbi:MAG TPA: beta-propeller fold lactonase family protein [Rhodoglobus sp.]|nr:beta-propeller fold lactonase family protein [Rhodoglobus sp.]
MGWLIGTYDASVQDGTGSGVYAADELPGQAHLAVALPSPSFLLGDGHLVHATLEGEGRVVTLRGDAVERSVDAGGASPCHLSRLGDRLVVANYGSGTLAVVGADGPEQVLDGEGGGPNPAQDGPHAHSSLVVGDRLLSADLGDDVVWVHAIEGGALRRTGAIRFEPGSGPRDLALLPSGDVLMLAELDGTLHLIRGDEVVSSVVVPGFTPGDHAGSIAVRDGVVYCGVRGSNRIAVVRLGDDALVPALDIDCGGDWPRHLALDGDTLHVANQRSHDVATFRIGGDGIPEQTGSTPVPSPAFVLHVT